VEEDLLCVSHLEDCRLLLLRNQGSSKATVKDDGHQEECHEGLVTAWDLRVFK